MHENEVGYASGSFRAVSRRFLWLGVLVAGAALAVVFSLVRAEESAMAAGKKKLEIGDPAPPFVLVGSDGKTYDSSDLFGKRAVVIAWFPKAFTGG